jgi:hypothetical protein
VKRQIKSTTVAVVDPKLEVMALGERFSVTLKARGKEFLAAFR